jgi:hypothetical protein
MADEVNVGAPAGGSGASVAPPASGLPGGTSGGTAPSAPMNDDQILESLSEKPSGAAPGSEAAPAKVDGAEATPEINLDALKEAQPEWLAKVTDEGAKAEIAKLLATQEKFSKLFKDDPDYDGFLKELPGGREQIAALQTLSKEVTEMDGHIAANTPESNAAVVERYLGEAPDKGIGLFRAGAQHLAKTNPEAYQQIGTELINSSLKASGIGADLQTVIGAVQEMRQAIAKDDGEAFGKAAAKLLGEPGKAAPPQADPETARLKADRETAQREANTARTEVWSVHAQRTAGEAVNHIRQMIGQALAVKVNGKPLISDVISAESRQRLADTIYGDVDAQLMADQCFVSQMRQLIGDPKSPLLTATKENFEKALELNKARIAKLLTPAMIKKHVETWARDVVAKNNGAIERAKGAAAGGDKVGGAPAPGSGGKVRPLTPEMLAKMSPEERDDAILAQLSRQ